MHDRSYHDIESQLKNSYYKSDIHYTLQMCQWLLKPIGVWPLISNQTNKFEQLVSIILMITCFSSLLFIILPSGHHYFFVEKNLNMKVKALGPVSFCVSSTIKYCYLALKGSSFERCIEHMKRDWMMVQDPNHRTIMLKYATISRRLITICAVFLYSGGMSYHTVMQFLSKGKNNYTIRPLPYIGYDPFFDTQSSPTYEIVYCIHCFTAMIMYSISTVAYSLAAIFVTHICGQIQIQIARLQKLVECKERKKYESCNLFALIVHDHVEILRFSNNIEEALKEICFTEIIECTLNMCMLEYYCLIEWSAGDTITFLTFFTLLTSFTFNIFIFCYIGEILTEQCSQIGTVSYEIDWYKLSPKEAYDLILLISISQYPPKLTAGKIIELSFNTFSSVAKTSVVYLNLLRTVTDW
ncbi:odorant receptor 4-like isoform X1 [Apis mellifera]|uniref:Odorant receptor n=2 Tax=Apis mellifera TaxID=7460 RepID=A0A7M7GYA5_APIME|nr:odorant receptor 4-like isoform X1 [Apis mellifera]|eukprot:XP_006565966.1 odorant receptor 4-like isoform X1 [Apis mellifera]